MAFKKIITVFGATGKQGGSVVRTFLSDPKLRADGWAVRGITRDPTKDSAKKLAAQGVEVVSGDLANLASLKTALAGSHTVFGVTNYWDTISYDGEIQQGRNIADAAAATSGLQHLIFSSLPNAAEASGGALTKVYHFDSKAAVESYIRTLSVPATFLLAGFYMSNLDGPAGGMMQPPSGETKTWTLTIPAPADAPAPMFDADADTGKVVKAIVLNRESVLGKRIYAATAYTTMAELAAAVPAPGATFYSLPHDTFRAALMGNGLPEFAAEELLQNMRLLSEGGYYGGASLDETQRLVESAGDKMTTWEEFLAKSKTFGKAQ